MLTGNHHAPTPAETVLWLSRMVTGLCCGGHLSAGLYCGHQPHLSRAPFAQDHNSSPHSFFSLFGYFASFLTPQPPPLGSVFLCSLYLEACPQPLFWSWLTWNMDHFAWHEAVPEKGSWKRGLCACTLGHFGTIFPVVDLSRGNTCLNYALSVGSRQCWPPARLQCVHETSPLFSAVPLLLGMC